MTDTLTSLHDTRMNEDGGVCKLDRRSYAHRRRWKHEVTLESATDDRRHAAVVDTWLARAIDHGSSSEIVHVFQVALETLWSRAVTTLGSVTLTAVADRVYQHASERFAFLAAIDPRSNEPAKEAAAEQLATVPRDELIEGLRFGLIELLTVIGKLTAEILSPDLHAALLAIAILLPESDANPPNAPTATTGWKTSP